MRHMCGECKGGSKRSAICIWQQIERKRSRLGRTMCSIWAMATTLSHDVRAFPFFLTYWICRLINYSTAFLLTDPMQCNKCPLALEAMCNS